MPALPPPSMVIGAPMPGLEPIAVVGTALNNPNAMPAQATIIQQSGTSTAVSGPTNIVQTVTSTKVGTTLVWAVAVSASAASAVGGTPTGWTLSQSVALATLSLAIYTFPNNPGAITTVTFSSNAVATAGGIAAWFWELGSAPFVSLQGNNTSGNSTALISGGLTSARTNLIELAAGAWVLGAATAVNNSTPTGWSLQAQQSSTNGVTNNAALIGASFNPTATNVAYNFALTLSAGSVWEGAQISIPSLASGQVTHSADLANVVDQGAGYSAQVPGVAGWAVGGSKPGGNGGGQ